VGAGGKGTGRRGPGLRSMRPGSEPKRDTRRRSSAARYYKAIMRGALPVETETARCADTLHELADRKMSETGDGSWRRRLACRRWA
jgi:hypothetical protein